MLTQNYVYYVYGSSQYIFYMLYVDLQVIWHEEFISEVKINILTGALVAGSFIMGHLPTYLHIVCRFIGYWARQIHFWGQNKYSSILTAAPVAGSYIMGHPVICFACSMSILGYQKQGFSFLGKKN